MNEPGFYQNLFDVLGNCLTFAFPDFASQITERRNAHRISRELDTRFPDASDLEVRKASVAGDVCCICLGSMTVVEGASPHSVKRVGCGHMFHMGCLRQVVERERSLKTSKCPLCRASLATGQQEPPPATWTGGMGGNDINHAEETEGANHTRPASPAPPLQIEHSLIRFSTENILPAWLPVPAFAFEVVRRETAMAPTNPNLEGGWQRFFRRGGQVPRADVASSGGNDRQDTNGRVATALPLPEAPSPPQETSLWRRFLVLIGAVPMSPEEEAAALEQLVDMFPQYDRADLLRELRALRSGEAVAEAILLGLFAGAPRGIAGE